MENANYTGPSPGSGDSNVETLKSSHEKQDLEDNKDLTLKREETEEEEDGNMGEKSKMALSEDPTKVKFTSSMANHGGGIEGSNNGEAKVDIENVQLSFAGMSKEELMKFADDPFWVRLRWILFVFFWIIWISMLAGAIIIVVMTPGCPPAPKRDWWHKTVIYQIYPRSFKDSNGDGVGDLKGIESKLDYIKDLGVKAIWLNPIFKSPMKDGGYDISNFVDIDSVYGSLDDFKSLVNASKERDIHVLLDFVPNHSSNQHEWFIKSRRNESIYSDYYIWRDGKRPREPPNNWLSVFGGSAWVFDTNRNQYYLHQFLDAQPDLNLRNPLVRKELENILRFWLDLGVDGFRVDAINHLFESEDLSDETPSNKNGNTLPESYEYLNHTQTTGLPEIFDVLREWRLVLDSYEKVDGKHRLLLTEVYDNIENTMSYYGNESYALADFPFNFQLVDLKDITGASEVYKRVNSWLRNLPAGAWPNWVLGNHDVHRLASRVGEQLVDAFNMIVMLIGGTPVTYYGEEIGMLNGFVEYEKQHDPLGLSHSKTVYENYTRDFERTPMQWSNESNAGFSNASGELWLPLANNYALMNVEAQLKNENSHLSIYKKLVKLRDEPAVVYGDLHHLVNNDVIFSFARVKKGSPSFAVVVNFGPNDTTVDLTSSKIEEFKFPVKGTLLMRSSRPSTPDMISKADNKVPFEKVHLEPNEAVVITFAPSFN